jgi:hypothetical protein
MDNLSAVFRRNTATKRRLPPKETHDGGLGRFAVRRWNSPPIPPYPKKLTSSGPSPREPSWRWPGLITWGSETVPRHLVHQKNNLYILWSAQKKSKFWIRVWQEFFARGSQLTYDSAYRGNPDQIRGSRNFGSWGSPCLGRVWYYNNLSTFNWTTSDCFSSGHGFWIIVSS